MNQHPLIWQEIILHYALTMIELGKIKPNLGNHQKKVDYLRLLRREKREVIAAKHLDHVLAPKVYIYIHCKYFHYSKIY